MKRITGFFLFMGVLILTSSPFLAEDKPERIKSSLKTDIIFCADVEDREPVDDAKKFSASQKEIYAWTRIEGASQPTKVIHKWNYKGEFISEVELKIHSSSYRTWSKKTVEGMPGRWSVEVVDAAGRFIAEKPFLVKKR